MSEELFLFYYYTDRYISTIFRIKYISLLRQDDVIGKEGLQMDTYSEYKNKRRE